MKITTFRTWNLIDVSDGVRKSHFLPAGTYEVEEVKCPLGHDCNWYVIKDTLIGASVPSLRQWEDYPIGDPFRIDFSDSRLNLICDDCGHTGRWHYHSDDDFVNKSGFENCKELGCKCSWFSVSQEVWENSR